MARTADRRSRSAMAAYRRNCPTPLSSREIQFGHFMALRSQFLDKRFDVSCLVQHSVSIVDRGAIAEIEFSGMNSETAWLQRLQRRFDKPEPIGNTSEMLQSARRPTEIEFSGQCQWYRRHVDMA